MHDDISDFYPSASKFDWYFIFTRYYNLSNMQTGVNVNTSATVRDVDVKLFYYLYPDIDISNYETDYTKIRHDF